MMQRWVGGWNGVYVCASLQACRRHFEASPQYFRQLRKYLKINYPQVFAQKKCPSFTVGLDAIRRRLNGQSLGFSIPLLTIFKYSIS